MRFRRSREVLFDFQSRQLSEVWLRVIVDKLADIVWLLSCIVAYYDCVMNFERAVKLPLLIPLPERWDIGLYMAY